MPIAAPRPSQVRIQVPRAQGLVSEHGDFPAEQVENFRPHCCSRHGAHFDGNEI